MSPDFVADVGNSRVKWGRCSDAAVVAVTSLPPGAPEAWDRQIDEWEIRGPKTWVIAGSHPARREALAEWLHGLGHAVRILEHPRELPLVVKLEHPEWAGVDRLLDAVAANSRRRTGVPAVLVDAGTAVTVDWVDAEGAFCGGAIMPGLRLMIEALHSYTALLPLIDMPREPPPAPGSDTRSAMATGVFWAVVGGIEALTARLAARGDTPDLFVTGGDAVVVHRALGRGLLWPEMTLEGIRLSAAGLPS